jgi:hypothetical protein
MHSRVYISQEWKGQSSQMRSLHSCIPNTCKLSFLRLTPTDAPFRDSNPKIDQNCWKQPSNRWSKPEPRFVEGRDLEMEQFGPLPKWMSAPPDHHCALSAKPHRPPLPTPASSGEQRHRPLLASPVSLTLQTSSSARASSFEQPSIELWRSVGGWRRWWTSFSSTHTHRGREQRRMSPASAAGGRSPRTGLPLLRRSPWSPPWARPDLDGLKKRAAAEDSMRRCGWAMEDSMQRKWFYVMENEASVGTRSPSIGALFTVHDRMSGIGLARMVPPFE